MRLLLRSKTGDISLTKDLVGDDPIPPYAILSHTWGLDTEEVTFEDIINGTGKDKPGYEKIRFCGEQARQGGLQHVWIDTCCINKSNSSELSEAIISMFRWYRDATKCYVYLADVSTVDQQPRAQLWEPVFRKSKWFTRGWTLQELLAPSSVEFFSIGGQLLGSKNSLQQQIHEITGIPLKALQGHALSEFSVAARLSWAESRETKRKEDKAYSLLGMFNVNMPPLYGEGRESAFRRLHEQINKLPSSLYNENLLNCLPCAIEAPFNTYQRRHDPTCLPDTRVDLLRDIHHWAGGDNELIYWLSGLAGTGKSTIARTVAQHYCDKNRLGASFFFSRGGGDVGHANKFVTSLACQLASSIPTLHHHIWDAARGNSDIANRSLREQWHQLILHPLSKLDVTGCQTWYVLVVDALDECAGEDDIRIILHLLAEIRSLERIRLRVFLTSRPEIPVRHGFYQIPDEDHQDFVLHNISPSVVDKDIAVFIEYHLKAIWQERSLVASWPGEDTVRLLVQAACGMFIWAATACRYIREGKRFAATRLNTILKGRPGSVSEPEKHLDEIYTTVLSQSVSSEFSDEEKKESYRLLRQELLHVTKDDIDQTLADLHSVVDIPSDQIHPLRLHHPSFRDFLLSKDRCLESDLWVDETQAHQMLVDGCLRLLSTSLKQDICKLNTPGTLAAKIDSRRVGQYLQPEIQYACLYWIQHLERSKAQLCDDDQVHQFLQQHFLHWVEALGWMGKVSEGVHAIVFLESLASVSIRPKQEALLISRRTVIEQAPLQTYCSALIFAPEESLVKKQFKVCMPPWIRTLPKVDKYWNALLQTVEGHSSRVNAVSFSPDGKTLASASGNAFLGDATVKLWDATSGAVLRTLEGHFSSVNAVSFSPDGKTLASVSDDKTIKLWDAASSALLQTLGGHSGSVKAVSFSPDGKTLASVSGDWLRRDNTVQLWDATSGAMLQPLEGHSGSVNAISFSPDGKTLASVSDDKTIKLWDAASSALLQTLGGHSGSVKAVSFSPDGKTLASVSDDAIKLWDTASGALLQTLKSNNGFITAVSLSPDGKTLALASTSSFGQRNTVELWDTASGFSVPILHDHSTIRAVSFSPDGKTLALASDGMFVQNDTVVELWDAASSVVLQTLHIAVPIQRIFFSDDSTTLQTNRGSLLITFPLASQATRQNNISSSVFIDEQWVQSGGENMLWLPVEYRTNCVAVHGNNTVGLGYDSGRLSIMAFNF